MGRLREGPETSLLDESLGLKLGLRCVVRESPFGLEVRFDS
jgi:hypothetical protein